eukprot:TRINITY_DN1112_c1_g1_i1.p1 TRINITY_DN1112_c1_g1~~TRINITY_DN1112_c1_g1_i1.p1  ORF type:complete len:134 (-),score=71.47 TRINITY_DN1112_c1_g1_i1:69-425(-)
MATQENKFENIATQKFADGLLQFLTPIVQACDDQLLQLYVSQNTLASQICLLQIELEKFANLAQSPNFQAYCSKLVIARQKLANLNQTLIAIMQRLDRLEKLAAEPARPARRGIFDLL